MYVLMLIMVGVCGSILGSRQSKEQPKVPVTVCRMELLRSIDSLEAGRLRFEERCKKAQIADDDPTPPSQGDADHDDLLVRRIHIGHGARYRRLIHPRDEKKLAAAQKSDAKTTKDEESR